MVGVLASSAVDRGFEPQSGQIKDYKIGICWFFADHAALKRKGKYWLARNQDNVSEWCDMSFRGLFYEKSEHYTNPAKHVLLVQSEPFHSFIEK